MQARLYHGQFRQTNYCTLRDVDVVRTGMRRKQLRIGAHDFALLLHTAGDALPCTRRQLEHGVADAIVNVAVP